MAEHSESFKLILPELEALIADIRKSFEGLDTLPEGLSLITEVGYGIVRMTEGLGQLKGSEKKAVALEALEHVIDTLVTPYDIKIIPNLAERFFDATVKEALLWAANGIIDGAVAALNRFGW